ncbi:hypothetical protein [Nevskia soli]|uniref:hypothetical protein n=1 Tax=Nevskia soli TaxID=418856 RepID=UPI0015D82147|nr:hypothetical protein [Nevskia soli]
MTDFIKRLRERAEDSAESARFDALYDDAADLIEQQAARIAELESQITTLTGERAEPISMVLYCPNCGAQHIDAPESEPGRIISSGPGAGRAIAPKVTWANPPHRSHLCHACRCIWRPADVPTIGVECTKTEGKADTWPNGLPQDAIAAVATLTDSSEKVRTWQPIETAPHDGSMIIIACIADGIVFDVCNGKIEVLAEDEDDGPWDICNGEPWCSYVGRDAGTYFCCWLPGKEWERSWRVTESFEYTHWTPLPDQPKDAREA